MIFFTRHAELSIARARACAGLMLLCGSAQADQAVYAKSLDIRADAGFMYDDNVTRANTPADKLSDRSYSANLSLPYTQLLTEHTRLRATALVGGERFITYKGLSRAIGGGSAEYQYRSSSEFATPTFSLFARVFGEQYESKLRDGWHYSAGASMLQPVTDRIQLFGALSHNQRRAYSEVFDTTDNSARLNLDYIVTSSGTLYLSGDYRRGDVVSTGHPSLGLIDIAKVFAADDVFPGLDSYRFSGSSLISTLGYNIGFGSSHSLDISWRRITSTSSLQPGYAAPSASYVDNQYLIAYLVNF
ncbi:MAG: hypothetical protein ACYCY7_00370 [Gallionella sp.]